MALDPFSPKIGVLPGPVPGSPGRGTSGSPSQTY